MIIIIFVHVGRQISKHTSSHLHPKVSVYHITPLTQIIKYYQ